MSRNRRAAQALLTFAATVAAFALGHWAFQSHPHACYAPCTVTLPDRTQEDEFGLDYTHRGRTPVVRITRKEPT